MSQHDNTNRGALFKSKERRTEKSPEYYGSLNVGGKEFKLSAWVNTSKKTGEKYFALTVKPKDDPGAAPDLFNDPSNDLPF